MPAAASAGRSREALLSAASAAFLAADDAPVEEIAWREGVAVGAGCRHCATHEALVVEVCPRHVAALRRGTGEALESIAATDSPVFDDALREMVRGIALDELLAAGIAAGLARTSADGRVAAILYDGLRHGAANASRPGN